MKLTLLFFAAWALFMYAVFGGDNATRYERKLRACLDVNTRAACINHLGD